MTDFQLTQEAIALLGTLRKAFATHLPESPDESKMQSQLTEILDLLRKANLKDNDLLLELERFHGGFGFLVGMSSSKLTEEAQAAWRAYDKFHYEQVKSQLHVCGRSLSY